MDVVVQEFMNQAKLGAKQVHDNMILFCLLSANTASEKFISLDDALQHHGLRISEISKGGSVPELRVTNPSEHMVLLLDGEELVGAKQNRALNTTVLLAPKSRTSIPVSCVERGRWNYSTKHFESRSRTMNANLRRSKSMSVNDNLSRTGRFDSDQSGVWNEIDRKYARMSVNPSSTMAMSDIYESMKSSSEGYMQTFRPVTGQIGFIALIDRQIAGMEIINNYEVYARSHGKLVNSYVLDAIETAGLNSQTGQRSLRLRAGNFLGRLAESTVEERRSVSLGQDLRVHGPKITGCGLSYQNEIIQLSLFPNGHKSGHDSVAPLRRASSRRKSSQTQFHDQTDDIIID